MQAFEIQMANINYMKVILIIKLKIRKAQQSHGRRRTDRQTTPPYPYMGR
jgi:hypothetical protein